MALHYGEPIRLVDEVRNFLAHQRPGSRISLFMLRDFIVKVRSIEASDEEILGAVHDMVELGMLVPRQGSVPFEKTSSFGEKRLADFPLGAYKISEN